MRSIGLIVIIVVVSVALVLARYHRPPGRAVIAGAASCGDAESLVGQEHATFYGVLAEHVDQFGLTCVAEADGAWRVRIAWRSPSARGEATYQVARDGAITPRDATAAAIDQLARIGDDTALTLLR